MGVEQAMREEAREEAEETASKNLLKKIQNDTHLVPEFAIRDGYVKDELLALIEEDPDIRILVLAASPDKAGPGPPYQKAWLVKCLGHLPSPSPSFRAI